MADPISGATQAPPQSPPRPQREDAVKPDSEPRPQQRAEAPSENERTERRPDPDDRVGTRVDTQA